MIDSGHGGYDTGTQLVIAPYTKEKILTLQTAQKVRYCLQQMGYHVVMTRKRDVFVPLHERVAIAKKNRAELFVSIHFNHAPNPKAHGIEIYFFKSANNPLRSQHSQALAQAILQRASVATNAFSRGVLHGDFHVIRETTMPAVLIEGGFFSNQSEAACLKNPRYIQLLARSIAEGIDAFVKAIHKQEIVLGAN